jgi:uncharacterized membrane protein (UPF0182 family)
VLISASARAFVVISDPDRHSSGASLTSAFSRVAHAWSRQDPRMLFRSLPAPNPAILLYAGVRERLQRLAPFYAQDSHIYPVVVSDTLHWIVQLYSHAATYPLSLPERRVGDGASRYFRHAATAIINATTGHATLYAAPAADPVAQAWAERIPELIRDPRDVPGALAPLLPPPIDGILAQAAAFARYGSRGEAVIDGVLPVAHVADTLRGIPVPGALMLLPSLGPAPALVLPVLDSHDVMRALIIGVGGSNPRTYRLDLESVSRPWSELRRLLASVREGEAARDDAGGIEAGEFGVIPLPSETLPYQSIFRVRGTAMPTLAALSMVDRDSVVTAPGLAEALDVRSPARTTTDTLAFRSEVQSLYEQMRVALRNQDLTAFATAFDALGRVLAERRR